MKNSRGLSTPQILLAIVVIVAVILVAKQYMMPQTNSQDNYEPSKMMQNADKTKAEANKKLVGEYAQAAFNDHDIEKAASYLADNFKQHNPQFPDGVEGFKGGLKYLLDTYPNLKVEGKRIFADGDYVITHASGDLGTGKAGDKKAIVDIFRIENGKIAEHWDVIEDVPAEAQNTNTMF